jgi:hypothetical protein
MPPAAALLRGLLNVRTARPGTSPSCPPAELLAEQRRTQRIFEMVMVAIASISLLVGGHRHHEHHARQRDGADP